MPDIFSVEPPRWLQQLAQPIDTKLTGQALATVLGGALGAATRGQEKVWQYEPGKPPYLAERGGSWLSNFLPAMGEARMGIIDPMWRIKANQLQLKTAADVLGLVETQADIDLKRDTLKRRASDVDKLGWFSLTPDERLAQGMPAFEDPQNLARGVAQQGRDIQWNNQRAYTQATAAWVRHIDELGKSGTKEGELAAAKFRAIPVPFTGPTPEMLMEATNADIAVAQAKEAARAALAATGQALGGATNVIVPSPGGGHISYTSPSATGPTSLAAQYQAGRLALQKQGALGEQFAAQLPYRMIPTQADMDRLQEITAQHAAAAQAALDQQTAAGAALGGPVAITVPGPGGTKTVYRTPDATIDLATQPPDQRLSDGSLLQYRPNRGRWQAYRVYPDGRAQPITWGVMQKEREDAEMSAMLNASRDPAQAAKDRAYATGLGNFIREAVARKQNEARGAMPGLGGAGYTPPAPTPRMVPVVGPPGPDGKPIEGFVPEGKSLPPGWRYLTP